MDIDVSLDRPDSVLTQDWHLDVSLDRQDLRLSTPSQNIAVFDLVSDVDHGLTYVGCQQSDLLRKKVRRACTADTQASA